MSKMQPKSKLKCSIDVREHLREKGFALVRAAAFALAPKLRRSLCRLVKESRRLPADPRAKNGERRRRYGRYVYLPWDNSLSFRPVATYVQDSALNPQDGGVVRKFEELTGSMRANRFLNELIRFNFATLPVSQAEEALPWDVGVHVVQMFARPGIPGVSSPDCLHKDGEPFTYIHLLERHNVTGGENVVADNAKGILLESTLTSSMDSLVVRDDAVYHCVKRIEVVPGAPEGFRTVLLIDFTPMKPQTLGYQNLA